MSAGPSGIYIWSLSSPCDMLVRRECSAGVHGVSGVAGDGSERNGGRDEPAFQTALPFRFGRKEESGRRRRSLSSLFRALPFLTSRHGLLTPAASKYRQLPHAPAFHGGRRAASRAAPARVRRHTLRWEQRGTGGGRDGKHARSACGHTAEPEQVVVTFPVASPCCTLARPAIIDALL